MAAATPATGSRKRSRPPTAAPAAHELDAAAWPEALGGGGLRVAKRGRGPAGASPGQATTRIGNDQALADLTSSLQSDPHDVLALQLRGSLRQKLGLHKEAIQDFDATLAILPQCATALAGRGAAKRAVGRQEAAVADCDAALLVDPGNAAVLASRGIAKLELGWYKEAAIDFASSFRLDPQLPIARWGCSMAQRLERDAPLRSLLLVGFERDCLNSLYIERRQAEFSVNGGPTYWSADGLFFLYWCRRELRWKGARASDAQRIAAGSSASFMAAPLGANILSPSLLKGWREWDGAKWVAPPGAGVASIGPTSAPLRTVVLAGFARAAVNANYLERRQLEFSVGGRETYWSLDGGQLLYWCKGEARWKGCASGHLRRLQEGGAAGFVGAPPGADLLAAPPRRGWHEWYGKEWAFRPEAGVSSVSPAADLLRTVTLLGFKRATMNTRYLECRSPDSFLNSRETYLSPDHSHLLYWCSKECRWKGSSTSHVPRIRAGGSPGFLGAPQNADVLSPALVKGWHEWFGKKWSFRMSAGVYAIGATKAILPEEWEEVEGEECEFAPSPGSLSGTDTEAEEEEERPPGAHGA